MKGEKEFVGRCPECNRPVYVDEITHKLHFSCKVHPCVTKEEFVHFLEDNDTDYWR